MVSRVKAAAKTAAGHPKTPRQPVPAEIRLADLLAFITARGKATLVEIASAMGYAMSTARTYAIQLCEEDRMHRINNSRAPGGLEYVYYAGPAPAGTHVSSTADISECSRPARKTYPLCHRRDPLDCMLFGVPAAMMGTHP